jgi:hypothetical protein
LRRRKVSLLKTEMGFELPVASTAPVRKRYLLALTVDGMEILKIPTTGTAASRPAVVFELRQVSAVESLDSTGH